MNIADALAHVAAHRAAGTIDQLDAEMGYTPTDRLNPMWWPWDQDDNDLVIKENADATE